MIKFLKDFLNGGITREELNKVQDKIDSDNLYNLNKYIIISFIYFTLTLILGYQSPLFKECAKLYISGDVFMIFLGLSIRFVKNKSHRFVSIMILCFQYFLMVMAIFMKVAIHPEYNPVMLIVFGMMLPILFVDDLWKFSLIDIYAVLVMILYNDRVTTFEIENIILYLSLGFIIAVNVTKMKREKYIYQAKSLELSRNEIDQKENELKIAKLNNIVSQMQPHFIYNTLAVISSLCDVDPKKAKQVTIDFSSYLRKNIRASMTQELIPFEDELEHINAYVNIQKVRFDDLIEVEYDIRSFDFFVPPLSVQPIVENAIKHGILNKEDGGKISISTREDNQYNVVIVEDNGVGFDVTQPTRTGHLGLENIKVRVTEQCHGKVDIVSKIGEGTKVTMYFAKNNNENPSLISLK